MNKTGIELIAQERHEQIHKHRRTVEYDSQINSRRILCEGAIALISNYGDGSITQFPDHWSPEICAHMISKPYKERLIIAGAFIAAEIDRLQFEEQPYDTEPTEIYNIDNQPGKD